MPNAPCKAQRAHTLYLSIAESAREEGDSDKALEYYTKYVKYHASFVSLQRRIAELNGYTFDEAKEVLIQVWMSSREAHLEELGHESSALHMDCDNLSDHSPHIQVNGDDIRISMYEYTSLPLSLFKGKKEGDKVNIKLPVQLDDGREVIINLCLTLAQSVFRYRFIPTFEAAIDRVLPRAE